MWGLFLLLALQWTCELIKDSSLWHSNFIPSVHDSIIIIGSGFVIFIPSIRVSFISIGLGCSIKILILAFLGKYSNIVCWVSKCVCWGSHHLPISVYYWLLILDPISANFRPLILVLFGTILWYFWAKTFKHYVWVQLHSSLCPYDFFGAKMSAV